MAKITISCSIPVDAEEVTEFLHKYVAYSRLGAYRKLRMGEKGCFYPCSLYTDDHAKVSRLIRRKPCWRCLMRRRQWRTIRRR